MDFKNLISINSEYIQQWTAQPDNVQFTNSMKQLVTEYSHNLANLDARFSEVMVGASGAVYGVLFAYGYLFPNTLIYVYFLIPIKAKYLVLLMGAFEFFSAWRSTPGDNIAHVAHLGGMLFGFILLLLKIFYEKKLHQQF
jgi:membrane associated rhomboid family serine protease